MQDNLKIYSQITRKLRMTRRKETGIILAAGFLLTLTATILAIMLAAVVENFAMGDSAFRAVLAAFVFMAFGVGGAFFLTPGFKRIFVLSNKPSLDSIALRVGAVFPDLKDNLCNAVQLYKIAGESKTTSSELALAAFGGIARAAADRNYDVILNTSELKKAVAVFFLALALAFILFFSFSPALGDSLYRVANFNESFLPPPPFSIAISPKSAGAMRGETVSIIVKAKGAPPETITLNLKEEQQEKFDSYTLRLDTGNTYRYEIISLKQSVVFYAEASWLNSVVLTETGTIRVIDKPIVRAISGTIHQPAYTGLAPRAFTEQNADISALKGTRVDLQAIGNKELSSAYIIYERTRSFENIEDTASIGKIEKFPLKTDGRSASGSFRIASSGSYFVQITDADGQQNTEPIKYSIIALNDSYPTISLVEPQVNVQVNENGLLPIKAAIADDFGFSSLKLYYKLIKSKYTSPDANYKSLSIPLLSNDLSIEIPYIWNLHKLGISPEDVYEFYLEVWDNDRITGPKSSKTQTLTVRLPSLDEVLTDAADRQKQIENELQKTLKEAIETKKEMEELNRELLKKANNKQLDWKEKKKAEDILKKQAELREKVSKLQENLQDVAESLQENKALSQETMQKYQELQKLMQEVNAPELRMAQQKMEQALKNVSPEQLQKAMKEAEFNEEQFRRSIERTLNLLKRVKAEQKADALTKRAEELAKKQEELQKQVENSNPADSELQKDLARRQELMKQELDNINKELGELEQLMKEIGKDMPMNELDEAKDALSPQETRQEMQNAENAMKQGDNKKAKQSQQRASKNLKDFAQKMQKLKQEMDNKTSKEAIRKMQKAIADLLELSKNQEGLRERTRSSDYNSTQIPDYAKQQAELLEALANVANAMMELSQKSFAVTPEMGAQIGNAMRSMRETIEKMTARNTHEAAKQQGGAMASLNSAIMQMQEMLSNMQGQGSGSCPNPGGEGAGQGEGQGGMSFSERLQQLAVQQQGINMAMQQTAGSGGRMSPEQQAEYGRIAGEQGKAQKSMEELSEEQKKFGGSDRKALGDLNKLAEEMKEVVRDIQSGNITPETLKRQERILSRLLDATKSINDRDYERKRESKTAKDYTGRSPDASDFKTLEDRNRALRDLLQSIQQGYTKDYENLIRQYFDALQKQDINILNQ